MRSLIAVSACVAAANGLHISRNATLNATVATVNATLKAGVNASEHASVKAALNSTESATAKANNSVTYTPIGERNEQALEQWDQKTLAACAHIAQHAASVQRTPCVMIDVGANVGAFSRQVMQLRPDCTVYAFEPVDELYSYAKDKLAGNAKAFLNHAALCAAPGTSTIYRNQTGNKGWNTMETNASKSSMAAETITCVKFDDYAASEGPGLPLPGPPAFVKIDVEGYEYSVINGMHEQFTQWQAAGKLPILHIEVGWGVNGHPNWAAEEAEFEWLFAHGYQRFDYKVITATTNVQVNPI